MADPKDLIWVNEQGCSDPMETSPIDANWNIQGIPCLIKAVSTSQFEAFGKGVAANCNGSSCHDHVTDLRVGCGYTPKQPPKK